MLLDEFVPEHDFGEVHSTRLSAPPERALEEIKLANLDEMPLVRWLFAVRSIPARLGGKRGLPSEKAKPLYRQMLEFGFVLLAEEPGRELVFGGIGQMFKMSGGLTPVFRDADEFAAFMEPGYAKVAMNFSAGRVDGSTELRTETRVLATNAASRRRFGCYWRLIRPGSALVRQSWLGAAKRRTKPGPEAWNGKQGCASGP